MKVYLAGPDVFLKNGLEIIAAKQELARQYGFTPMIWQGEEDAPQSTRFAFGLYISAANEAMMRASDLILANLTPFRGISADIGTAYELGFMVAMGKPAYGYSNDGRLYTDRLTSDYYKGQIHREADGMLRGPDGQMVENNDMADNLMLDGGIEHMGGVFIRRSVPPAHLYDDLGTFEECLAAARDRLLGGNAA